MYVQLGINPFVIPQHKTGRWLAEIDLLNEDDGTLTMYHTGTNGKCGKECSLAARSCRSTFDDSEKVESLWSLIQGQRSVATIQKKLCEGVEKKKSNKGKNAACAAKNLGLVVGREWDEEFVEEDKKLAEMQDMMADMKAKTGMGISLNFKA